MNFIIDKSEYLKVIAAWTHPGYRRDAKDHIIYNVLRGHPPTRGFYPTIKEQKLANGKAEWSAFNSAKILVLWAMRDSQARPHHTPARQEHYDAEYKHRLVVLSTSYGVTFTPELVAAIREALK